MCRWNINKILGMTKIQNLIKLDYEISVILYLSNDKVRGHEHYDRVGNKEGVETPSINEIIKGCKANNTNKIILIHNHPYIGKCCDSSPSYGDLLVTKELKKILNNNNIVLLDHIIIGQDSSYYSFKANELI